MMSSPKSTSKRFSKGSLRQKCVVGVIFLSLICVIGVIAYKFWRQDPPPTMIEYYPISVNWEEVGKQLTFSLDSATAELYNYTLKGCKVTSITPYAEEALKGAFHYIRLSYRGVLVQGEEDHCNQSREIRIVAYARLQLSQVRPVVMFQLTSVDVGEIIEIENKDTLTKMMIEKVREAIRSQMERLTFTVTETLPMDGKNYLFTPLPNPAIEIIDVPFVRENGGDQ